MAKPQDATTLDSYKAELNPDNTASLIQAARLSARDLLDTGEILFTLKRFPHSMLFSTLAIEESSKQVILLSILCAPNERQRFAAWKSYRNHMAKTQGSNKAIESQIRVNFPKLSREQASKIGSSGPTPKQLERNKQLSVYSDGLDNLGECACHYPAASDWRELAWERLCEAQSLVHSLRDRTPKELRIFQKHFKQRSDTDNPHVVLTKLKDELLENGCIQEGWWDTILQDVQYELDQSGPMQSESES